MAKTKRCHCGLTLVRASKQDPTLYCPEHGATKETIPHYSCFTVSSDENWKRRLDTDSLKEAKEWQKKHDDSLIHDNWTLDIVQL